MSFRSWLRGSSTAEAGSTITPNGSSKSAPDPRDLEISDLQDAMEAAALIMNDDIDGAESRLKLRKDSSAFHQLGLGVSTFMRSILGFEKEIMAEAASRLTECETRAWADMKKAQRAAEGGSSWFGRGASSHVSGNASQIYPPGSEFQLVHANAQLMNAVVAVMHESLTEGIKGFYKLRKAFISLDAIMQAEERVLGEYKSSATGSRPQSKDVKEDEMPGSFDETEFDDLKTPKASEFNKAPEDDSDLDFVDAAEGQSGTQTPATYGGHLAEADPKSASASRSDLPLEKPLEDLSLDSKASDPDPTSSPELTAHSRTVSVSTLQSAPGHLGFDDEHGPSSDLFKHPVDAFVHSGANMCFGILLLIISMVPPAFSRLLYIIGFKGDRDRGVRMLWQSTKFANINGAVAGLVLLAYYNGLLAFADVIPTDEDIEELADKTIPGGEIVGYPRERCAALLASMRQQYPESRLWKLEEARILANKKELDEAMTVLRNNTDSKMRQVTALNNFELSINAMFCMDWPLMRESFVRCIELNDWSHSLYYYIAGSAEVEMYRDAFHAAKKADDEKERETLETEVKKHKKAAEEYFKKSPSVAGRKRFMARQMPFEVFVLRKIQKFEQTAAALGVDLVDGIGVSPASEMTWLWNGSKKMPQPLLGKALEFTSWDRCTVPPESVEKMKAALDDVAIKAVCETALLRGLGRFAEARALLEPVLKSDPAAFKGPTKDDYALPAAHYEMAVVAWSEACARDLFPKDPAAIDEYRLKKVNECWESLDRVTKWESFNLDARIGMRVQAGLDSIRWLKKKKKWT